MRTERICRACGSEGASFEAPQLCAACLSMDLTRDSSVRSEHLAHTQGVASSNLAPATIIILLPRDLTPEDLYGVPI